MTIKVTVKHDGPHGKVAIYQGSAQVMDDHMEVIREGKEMVPGITTTTLDPGESVDLAIWKGVELVVREIAAEPLPVVAGD